MKLATMAIDDHRAIGAVTSDSRELRLLRDAAGNPLTNMLEVVRSYGDVDGIDARLGFDPVVRSLADVRLVAPLIPPRNVLCVGKNYRDHAREFGKSGFDRSDPGRAGEIPPEPIVFTKPAAAVIGYGEAIRYPHGVSDCLDYEAELAVVIGKGGRGIPQAHAYEHVFGYTILNDVTARDLQARHQQWFIGKSLDTFCPMGPWLVTRDEVDPTNLEIRCWVNGELRQQARTRDLVFDVPALIETLSAGMTLLPGDVIATGTPAGVGIGFQPPKFLRPGDEVAIEITGLGRLVNQVA